MIQLGHQFTSAIDRPQILLPNSVHLEANSRFR